MILYRLLNKLQTPIFVIQRDLIDTQVNLFEIMTVDDNPKSPSNNNICNAYLNSVCPGITSLEDNVHYQLPENKLDKREIDWPFSGPTEHKKAVLEGTYLNIARPPLNGASNESTTYVSLPLHINEQFRKIVEKQGKLMEGSMHIGANLNPLLQDRFNYVHLNPGCLSAVIDIDNMQRSRLLEDHSQRRPIERLTENFGKLLKIPIFTSGSNESDDLKSLLNPDLKNTHPLIEKVLHYDAETFQSDLRSPNTLKLLISAHINVLNVFILNSRSRYCSLAPPHSPQLNGESDNIEVPLLRLKFNSSSLITCIKTFVIGSYIPMLLIGFESSEILMLNLSLLEYQVFDNLSINKDYQAISTDFSPMFGRFPVTSLDVIRNPKFEFLVLAGFANGEVVILNPASRSSGSRQKKYVKTVVDKDEYVTFFKKFDLSPFATDDDNKENDYPPYLVGHFKVSHKPITSICSTLPYDNSTSFNSLNPLVIAIGSDDGFVKLIDLIYSRESTLSLSKSIVTDIISNYFNDGITDVKFSPDFKFLAVAGKGDIIEVFKMMYYNVNGLLNKNFHGARHSSTNLTTANRRSRSGTVNSTSSQNNFNFGLLSPHSVTPSHSIDLQTDGSSNKEAYLSIIKDIRIVARFKGHSNTVHRIEFVNDLFSSELQSSNDLVYKIVSCGFDGKIIFWDFDYKALPKVKQYAISKSKKTSSQNNKRTSLAGNSNRKSLNQLSKPVLHNRSRSMNIDDAQGFSLSPSPFNNLTPTINAGSMNMNTVLNSVSSTISTSKNVTETKERDEEQKEIIASLYSSLHELRLKKCYNNCPKRLPAIIHPIVNDSFVPSVEIPNLSLDFSLWIKNSKVDSFYLDQNTFMCFAKSGDIFKYNLVKKS